MKALIGNEFYLAIGILFILGSARCRSLADKEHPQMTKTLQNNQTSNPAPTDIHTRRESMPAVLPS